MRIAVIGGGINGIMTSWELITQGYYVTLFEKGEVMQQTSSASSKLLHGGLRYLENFEFRLVKEALLERQWWISQAPHLAKPLKLYIPIYKNSRRPAWIFKIGLWLYDFLAGKQNIGQHQSLTKYQLHKACPKLKNEDLLKGFSFYDAQMDDTQLGLWALEQATNHLYAENQSDIVSHSRLTTLNNTNVIQITQLGEVTFIQNDKRITEAFDRIINITGPSAGQLLKQSNIDPEYNLDLVRGSHILVDSDAFHSKQHEAGREENETNMSEKFGYFLEVPNERRIFFVLPYQGKTLIGTTEVRQNLEEPIEPSEKEIDYLIDAYNYYFKAPITKEHILATFAGLRPLIKNTQDPNKTTREYAIQKNLNLISVFGGKWTTSRQLSKKVACMVK